MAYLNLDLDYFTHPKTVRLVGLLGPEAVCLPIKLWCYVAKHHCEQGLLEAYSKQEVESVIGWSGESGQCVDAMVKIGLIEEIENGYAIHDWLEHAGHLAAFKKRAKSAAKKRWKKYASSIAKRKITNTPNLPNLTIPNLTNGERGHEAGEPASPPALQVSKKPKRILTGWPEGFMYNEKHKALAEGLGLNVALEFAQFRDKSLAKGYTYLDWEAAFRNWLRQAAEFRKARTA